MTLTIFDSSGVEPARQFDLFYETVNSRIIRITPERPAGTGGFPARVLSHCAPGRSCHIIDVPGHSARRTLSDIKSSDPEQVHLNYMLAGERRLRLRDCDLAITAGNVFAVNTWRPFELLGDGGSYRVLKLVFPAAGAPVGRPGLGLSHPDSLRAHRLYNLLCVTCGYLGSGLGQSGDFEISMLMSVAECLFALMVRQDNPEVVDDWRHEMFVIVNLEVERHLGDSEFDLDRLTHSLGVSRRYIQRLMERRGTTFSTLLRQKRMEFARGRLISHPGKIDEVAARSGYTELSAFYRAFKREFGYAPGAVRGLGNETPIAS